MKLSVERIEAFIWEQNFAADARRAVFSERLPPGFDRIDFALLLINARDVVAVGYMTCRELDAKTVYLKHGGAFTPGEKQPWLQRGFTLCLDKLLAQYETITTLVENTNRPYLKMAIATGFIPIGMRTFKGTTLVELSLEDKPWIPSPSGS